MHNIVHDAFPSDWSLEKLTATVRDNVAHSGDRYGTNHLRVPTNKVFDSYEEAIEYIGSVDRYGYDGIAVRYLDTSEIDSAKIRGYRTRISEVYEKKREYAKVHSVKEQKAAFIGCRHCGSKLNKSFLRGEFCPLCLKDLRSASTQERLVAFDKSAQKIEQRIRSEQLKEKAKAKKMWLVKYEYHS